MSRQRRNGRSNGQPGAPAWFEVMSGHSGRVAEIQIQDSLRVVGELIEAEALVRLDLQFQCWLDDFGSLVVGQDKAGAAGHRHPGAPSKIDGIGNRSYNLLVSYRKAIDSFVL